MLIQVMLSEALPQSPNNDVGWGRIYDNLSENLSFLLNHDMGKHGNSWNKLYQVC